MTQFLEFGYHLEDVALIDGHLHQRLSTEEEALLARRLEAEPELRNLLASLTGLSLAARRNQLQGKKALLRKLETQLKQPETPAFHRQRWVVYVIAAVLIVLIAVRIARYLVRSTTPASFTELYDPMQDLNQGFRSGGESDQLLADGLRLANDGHYRKAARAFELAFKVTGDTLHLYQAAISWIGAGRTSKASELLASCQPYLNADDFHYYYILNLVRDNAIDEARTYLNQAYPEIRPRRIERLNEQLQEY